MSKLEEAFDNLRAHLESTHPDCTCINFYWTLLRAAQIHLEATGKSPLFQEKPLKLFGDEK